MTLYTKISVKDTSTQRCKRAVERIQFNSDVSNEKAKALAKEFIFKYNDWCWYTNFAYLPGRYTNGGAFVIGNNKAGNVKMEIQDWVALLKKNKF